MKKRLAVITFVVVCLCLVVSISFSKGSEYKKLNIPMSGQEMPKINYEVTANESNLLKEAVVYKFILNDGKDEAKKLSKIFGLTDEPTLGAGNSYIVKQNDKMFTYENDSGYWSFENLTALSDIRTGKNIPSDDGTITIAKDFLKQHGLLQDRFTNIKVVAQSSGDKTTNDYRVIYKDVFLYPTVNNVPVYGVSRIIISVGDNGEIIGVSKYYKDFVEYKKSKLKDVKDAIDDVKNNRASNSINPRAKKAKIDKVELGYWEDAGTVKEQPHLQPVWVFSGEATLDGGEVEQFDAFVPALE